MTSTSRRSALGLAGASVAAALVLPSTASATSAGADRALRPGGTFDRYLADLAAKDTFSGTVLLRHRGRTVLQRSFGMADKARGLPNRDDTVFALGSITKIFTGIAIAQLVQQGKVSYHEKLGTYLDGFAPEIAGTVTVHQLLTHTSGLGDFMRVEGIAKDAPTWDTVDKCWQGCLTYARKDRLSFVPGSATNYSNSGYVALGAIVAAVSGRSYYDYVRDHVFRPAGMRASGFLTTAQWRTDRRVAHPYVRGPGGERVDDIDERALFIGTPAGDSFATADDLARFVDALLDHRLLDATHTELALSPKTPAPMLPPKDGKPAVYSWAAYAPSTDLVNGQWVAGHNGGAPGVSTNLDWFPATGWTAVVLSNYGGQNDRPAGPVVETIRGIITG